MSRYLLNKIRKKSVRIDEPELLECRAQLDSCVNLLVVLTEALVKVNNILIDENLMHLFEDDARIMTMFRIAQEEWNGIE